MDVNLDPREQEVVDTAIEFNRKMVVPYAKGWELQRKVPLATLRAAANAGHGRGRISRRLSFDSAYGRGQDGTVPRRYDRNPKCSYKPGSV
jgi:hypothetical protein